MSSADSITLVILLAEYSDALTRRIHAEQHGTHGDGKLTAAQVVERVAYRALLAHTAPDILADMEAREEIEAAHRNAMYPAVSGIYDLPEPAGRA